jgi:hypothetical protein
MTIFAAAIIAIPLCLIADALKDLHQQIKKQNDKR